MAGVSDQPFRAICAEMGAGLVVSEMVTSDTKLWSSNKSQTRLSWSSLETSIKAPKVTQIAGNDPSQMAEAARRCVDLGADVVDINMGCPAKKVCNKAAGSALLQDELLVDRILTSVVDAVSVPVTLKFRTGWSPESRNACTIGRIAEQAGIQALTLHGRTRACRFNGQAEYDSIAELVEVVQIPVIANGDIDSPAKAEAVLKHTEAAAVMVGRAAQGNPWLFQQIEAHLAGQPIPPAPDYKALKAMMQNHIEALHQFYGSYLGARIARKHVAWYLAKQVRAEHSASADTWRRHFQMLTEREEQSNAVCVLFERLHQLEDQAA